MDNFLYRILEKSNINVLRTGVSTAGKQWDRAFERNNQLNHHRIYFISEGCADFICSNCTFTAHKGQACFIPGNTLLSRHAVVTPEIHFLHFLFDSEINDLFSFFTPHHVIDASDLIRMYFEKIIENNIEKDPLGQLIRNTYSKLLLYEFFRNIATPPGEKMRFLSVLQYIDQNLSQKITTKELADRMYLNPVYFANLFSKTFNLSPQEYIIEKKLQRAKLLLTSSNNSIKEISELLGFESQLYFSRLFKLKTGVSPKLYREKMLH